MSKFTFKGVDASGQEVEGEADGDTQQDAIAHIRESGYWPTSVKRVGGEPSRESAPADKERTPLWSSRADMEKAGRDDRPPSSPAAKSAAALSKSPDAGGKSKGSESLPPYERPFFASLHTFAGWCSVIGFIGCIVYFLNAPSGSGEYAQAQKREALMLCVWTVVLALINFGLAQIIDIIARASYAARQQVILMRQLVRSNGGEPSV